ncbi:unnamed protein product [Prorocentrum cordatum]|uniref:Pentatricopeptide repeat-containing protein n=1 Tax=Prorocentrum cordatum TaxID=2364126 RepID=A0ABN9YFT7_9DINO|nr:unnamed protein product [Polarella glacialis]
MQDVGLTPNPYAYDGAIPALGNAKRGRGALDLFSSMKDAKVVPDVLTYTVILGASEKRVRPDMEASGPLYFPRIALISCWGKSKTPERDMRLLNEMQSKGWAPNAVTYSTLTRACERFGDRVNMFK